MNKREEIERTIEQHYGLSEGGAYIWKFSEIDEGYLCLVSLFHGETHAVLVRTDGTCVGV